MVECQQSQCMCTTPCWMLFVGRQDTTPSARSIIQYRVWEKITTRGFGKCEVNLKDRGYCVSQHTSKLATDSNIGEAAINNAELAFNCYNIMSKYFRNSKSTLNTQHELHCCTLILFLSYLSSLGLICCGEIQCTKFWYLMCPMFHKWNKISNVISDEKLADINFLSLNIVFWGGFL
jgi:hypothetical protein